MVEFDALFAALIGASHHNVKRPKKMITQTKLEIYKRYNGDIDGRVRVGDENEKNQISDNDWFEIQNLIQKISLLKNDLTSEPYAKEIKEILRTQTDSNETAKIIFELA